MFYEYAMDPAVISGWERARYFLGAFGPWKGRFIAEIPDKWKRKVYDGLNCPEVEKLRVIEALRQLDPRVFSNRSGFAYSPGETWVSNALRAHAADAFRGIITNQALPTSHTLDATTLDDSTPGWHVEPGQFVERNAGAFANALRLLLRRAEKRLLIIDPYFTASKQERRSALGALCALVDANKVTVHVHAGLNGASFEHRAKEVEDKLPDAIASGVTVNVDFWEPPETVRFHNRYILTDVGGVQLGDSIEQGELGHLDRLSILGDIEHKELYGQYAPQPVHLGGPGGPTIQIVGDQPRQ